MTVTKTILKLTPLHCVVKFSGTGESSTLALATDLLWSNPQQTEVAFTPKVNISGIWWTVQGATAATIARNCATLYSLIGAFHFDFIGFADTQENTSDIVVTLPSSDSEVVVELLMISGYNNTQHLNSEI